MKTNIFCDAAKKIFSYPIKRFVCYLFDYHYDSDWSYSEKTKEFTGVCKTCGKVV